MDNKQLKVLADKLIGNIEKVIVGKQDIIVQLFICLICWVMFYWRMCQEREKHCLLKLLAGHWI